MVATVAALYNEMPAVDRHLEIARFVEQGLHRLPELIERAPVLFIIDHHALPCYWVHGLEIVRDLSLGPLPGLEPVIGAGVDAFPCRVADVRCAVRVDVARSSVALWIMQPRPPPSP